MRKMIFVLLFLFAGSSAFGSPQQRWSESVDGEVGDTGDGIHFLEVDSVCLDKTV